MLPLCGNPCSVGVQRQDARSNRMAEGEAIKVTGKITSKLSSAGR